MRFIAPTLLALGLAAATPALAQQPNATLMSQTGIGPIRVGMTAEDIGKLGLPARPGIERIEEETRQRLDVSVANGAVVSAIFGRDAAKGASAVSTTSTAFATDRGARVGMPFEDIQRRHPGGVRRLDDEVRGALIYELPGERAAFEFDVKNVPRGCFKTNDGCSAPGPACSIVHSACADAWIGKKAQRFLAFGPPARKAS